MEKNVEQYQLFHSGRIKMPEHLAPRREVRGRLFGNRLMEALTRSRIEPPIVIHLLISGALFTYGIVSLGIVWWTAVIVAFAGCLFWSFAEYNVHRFLYHTETNSRPLYRIQHNAHGIHHQHPVDPRRLAMPPVPGLLFSGLFFLLFWLVSPTYVFVFFPGFMLGYLTYITMHYAQHRYKTPRYGPWKKLWQHHFVHHYVDPYSCYGVSTRLWDHVFGTTAKVKAGPAVPGS